MGFLSTSQRQLRRRWQGSRPTNGCRFEVDTTSIPIGRASCGRCGNRTRRQYVDQAIGPVTRYGCGANKRPRRDGDRGTVLLVVREPVGRDGEVLQRVRQAAHPGRPIGGVQASHGLVRRRGPFDGYRRGAGRRSGCARSWPRCWIARPRWYSVTAAPSTSSPATASWRCSVRPSRWRTTLFAPAWRPWTSRRQTQRLAAEVDSRDGIDVTAAGRAEFRSGDRGRNRLWHSELHRHR